MPGLDRLPLALASSKSFLGHSEPAAGVVGMLHAAHMLGHAMLPPIAHLVQLNPYVAAAVAATWGHWSMPRQAAGLVGLAGADGVSPEQQALRSIGTSAFAFQGKPLHCLSCADFQACDSYTILMYILRYASVLVCCAMVVP
jgi:acyl transferase domain-containing protein